MSTDLAIPTVSGRVHPSVVYYCRRGGLIKIGYTTRFVERMRGIEPDELLAVEPGGAEIETKRHEQFAYTRVRSCSDLKEWYGHAPELQAYVDKLTWLFEVPPLPRPRQQTRERPIPTGWTPDYGPRRNCKFKRSTAASELEA